MFYVGNELWLEDRERLFDIPNYLIFSGCIRYSNGLKVWYNKNELQSLQDPITHEWMPAVIYNDGRKIWYKNGFQQSFQNPITQEWMPAITYPDGTKWWYDKGKLVENPETYSWEGED